MVFLIFSGLWKDHILTVLDVVWGDLNVQFVLDGVDQEVYPERIQYVSQVRYLTIIQHNLSALKVRRSFFISHNHILAIDLYTNLGHCQIILGIRRKNKVCICVRFLVEIPQFKPDLFPRPSKS